MFVKRKNRNKWKGILIGALLTASLSGIAQPIRFSLYTAPVLSYAEADFKIEKSPLLRTQLGFEAAYYFRDYYSVSAGVQITNLGARMSSNDHDLKITGKYMDIPIRIKLSTEEIGYWTFYGKFGMVASYKTSEKVIIEPEPQNTAQERYLADFTGSIEFGLGAEYNFGGNWSVFAELSTRNSFTNTIRNDTSPFSGHEKLYLNAVALSFGVIF